jgi:hypothetical protein
MNNVLIDFQQDLRNGSSLHEALCKHNLSLKEAMDGMDKPLTRTHRKKRQYELMGKFIYRMGPYYVIQKSMNNITVNFGTYNSLSDAQRVRDYLVENGWYKSKLDSVCELLGVERRIK